MIDQQLYNDFVNYIKENNKLISFLEENKSLLTDYISPIIKSLTFLAKIAESDENNSEEIQSIFDYGLSYLFENLEQLKLYLRQLNNDYQLLDKMSFYIKIVFDLEELKMEIEKCDDIDKEEKNKDINRIDDVLEFFEDNIVPNVVINEFELDNYLKLYYDLLNKYTNIVLANEAFNEYCSIYGI